MDGLWRFRMPSVFRLRLIVLLIVVLFVMVRGSAAFGQEELEMVNRPVNLTGLTGLIFSTTPFTLPPRTIEFSAGTNALSSTFPDISDNELPFSVSVGLNSNMELALKDSYVLAKFNGGQAKRNIGDIELSYKWNFMPQYESSFFPALALIVSGIAPSENKKDVDVGEPAHWGGRIGISLGRENAWSDHVLGAYLDSQIAVQDLSDEQRRDVYSITNIGLLYPISKYRNLQLLTEYNLIRGKNRISDIGGDYTGLTYGLRMVSEKFNLTIGAQFIRNSVQGFSNASRVVGMASIKF